VSVAALHGPPATRALLTSTFTGGAATQVAKPPVRAGASAVPLPLPQAGVTLRG
jgi:hypothetical protein